MRRERFIGQCAQMFGHRRSWMYYLDPFTRLIGGLVTNELHELQITCSDREFYRFAPPAGQTCQQWAGDFVCMSIRSFVRFSDV
jgi:ABC-type multidrug transport system permease subunit